MWRLAILVVFLTGTAVAADAPKYGPPPDWVIPISLPTTKTTSADAALQPLLFDTQTRYGLIDDTSYVEIVVRIATSDGLKGMTSISPSWNPDTDTLTFNRVAILRDGKSIDLLNGGKNVTVIRRETGLESAALDGTLTATLQPQGLQVGDIIDFAITVQHRDPVLQGRSQGLFEMPPGGQVTHYLARVSWPDSKPIQWRATVGMPAPVVSHPPGETVVTIDQSNVVAPKPPNGAPSRFKDVGQLQLSQFATWADVSTLMAPLYAKAESLTPTSPLRAVIAQIRKDHSDAKSRAEAALRVTQDQTHYVYIGLNFGGYVPADADLTWSRRYGDCKGKTALLLALLHGLGIAAEPVLASTGDGAFLDQRLPNLELFDHVLVRTSVNGKVYWLDGTRTGDRSLDDIPIPDLQWVLPIRQGPTELVRIEPKPFVEPHYERIEHLDLSAGVDAPAPLHLEDIYRGDAAVEWQATLDQKGRTDALRELRDYWRGQKPWVESKTVDYVYDDAHRVMRLTLDGVATAPWTKNGGDRDLDIPESNLGFNPVFKREPGPYADAPFAVDFPQDSKWTVVVVLPNKGHGFSVIGGTEAIDRMIAGREYLRRAEFEGGQLTIVTEEKSLAPEFPFAEANEAAAALRELTAYDLTLRTSNSAESAAEELATQAPTSASAFNLRGSNYLKQHKYDLAVADFTQAAKLEPTASKHVYDRGAAYYEMGKDELALKDFDDALRLNPSDVFALLARADLELDHKQTRKAQDDFARALQLAPSRTMALQRQAEAYERAGLFPQSIQALDALLAVAKDDRDRAGVLNQRCWTRAEWGEQLAQALDDCEASLRVRPDRAEVLDSQGFVHLRLKQYGEAAHDFDDALALAPKLPTSLFGRGVVEIQLGNSKEGRSDIQSARTLDPSVDSTLSHLGLNGIEPAKP